MFDMFYKPTLLSHRGWEWTGQQKLGEQWVPVAVTGTGDHENLNQEGGDGRGERREIRNI